MSSHTTRPHASIRSRRLAVAAGLLLLAGAFLPAAYAQQQYRPVAAPSVASLETRDLIGKDELAWQLTSLLDCDLPNLRVQALQQIIFLAHARDAGYDFRPAVPRLLALYEHEKNEAVRVMALSALHAIGDDGAMRRLQARVGTEHSKRVRVLTLVALQEYDALHGRPQPGVTN